MNDDSIPTNFIRAIIDADMETGKHGGRVATRFPPEPNGYLHIGHAKSICLNFGIAEDYRGTCNVRFDDTNPHKENQQYVDAILDDVHWLGYDWDDRLYFASDYFEQLYAFAVELIEDRKAFVCDLTPEETREYRGTLTEPGRESPYRSRSVEENLDLFARMRAGDFPDGSKTLRARIDMASPNINMRDPVIYRIKHGAVHHQTGEEWCIYPMYDFTHPISDALEGITHSLCTLEFEDHRPLYDWTLDNISAPCHPQQIEFSRLNLKYTVMSKRKLTQLVDEGHVRGWDDPRMPTIAGLRRRGYTPASIREFCRRIGITKADNTVEMGVLETCAREDLDKSAPRAMAVLRPLKVVIENYPEHSTEELSAARHPKDPSMGFRTLLFEREIFIDREDFREEAPRKFKRLVSGGLVRLRNAYVIQCEQVIKDANGEVAELRCRYFPDTLDTDPHGTKVRGVIHWVPAGHAVVAELRLYDRLFLEPYPDAENDFKAHLNPNSLQVLGRCYLEPGLAQAEPGSRYQFEREGYYCVDSKESRADRLVFNRTVTLRDSWARLEAEHSGQTRKAVGA